MHHLSRRGALASLGLLFVPPLERNRQTETAPHVVMREATARLAVGRAAHTAVRLSDGTLLLMGGFTTEETVLASTDLYDADGDRTDAGPSMVAARHSHTATPLADGSVLIAGGFHDDAMNEAEIFDASTRTFREIAPMTTARSGQIAAVLPSGHVLLAGGVGTAWQFLDSAEIFDPETETFTAVGSMATPRESHTGTVLEDGRVLIAGGHYGRRSSFTVVQSAEMFDPTTQAFTDAGTMVIPRHKHDAVRLADGRVLLVAGADGRDGDGAYASTEVVDPESHAFAAGPNLITPRYKLAGTSIALSDGNIIVAGGASTAGVLDEETGAFSRIEGSFEGVRLFSTATLIAGDRIVVAGGYGSGIEASDRLWLIEREPR